MGASSTVWSRLRSFLEFFWCILFYNLLLQNQGVNWDPVTYCHLPPDLWVVQREMITIAFLRGLSVFIWKVFVGEFETDFATACILEKIRKIFQPFPHWRLSLFSLLSVEVVVAFFHVLLHWKFCFHLQTDQRAHCTLPPPLVPPMSCNSMDWKQGRYCKNCSELAVSDLPSTIKMLSSQNYSLSNCSISSHEEWQTLCKVGLLWW